MKPIVATFVLMSAVLMGQVLGVGKFTQVVGNLDRSIEFYRDALGLEMAGEPGPAVFAENAAMANLYDAPGARSRTASFKIPESDLVLEIVEFEGFNAAPAAARFYDPGAVTLGWAVPDLEAAKTRMHRVTGLEWIRASTREVVVRDPGGIFLTLRQHPRQAPNGRPPLSLPEDAEAWVGGAVEDLARTTQFYREALGFMRGRQGEFWTPGDGFPLRFAALNYVDRKPVQASVHDPGAGVLQLRVRDFDAVLNGFKAAGASVVSPGGQPVNIDGTRAVILRDPDNFFLQLRELAPAGN